MPASVDDVVEAATKEWTHWGSAIWNTITSGLSKKFYTDDEAEFASYVRNTYCAFVIDDPKSLPSIKAISADKVLLVGGGDVVHPPMLVRR